MSRFEDIAVMVRRLRSEARLTEVELANAVGLEADQIRRLEAGDLEGLSTAALARVARRFSLPPDELLSGKTTARPLGIHFKQPALSDFQEKDRSTVEGILREAQHVVWLNRALGLGDDLRQRFAPAPVGGRPYENGYGLATQVRDALSNKEGPLSDLRELLEEHFGILVKSAPLHTTRIQALCVKDAAEGAAAIILNETNEGFANPAKQRSDLAHELGHILGDPPVDEVDLVIDASLTEHPPQEQRANAFAAELLLPLAGLRRLLGPPAAASGVEEARERVRRARAEFSTTLELAVNHLINRGYVDAALREWLIENPLPIEPLPARQPHVPLLERRVHQALRASVISTGHARELLGLSVWDPLPADIVTP
ncbi:MAG TPA: ImmA/IrrE family metallo-endopeptidase [Polyangia bacterium]|jgi:Zn-dependent peptidase ImmA (M78 family)|nr:ImmA/IrrE family metallo-endopeptidase [Polyangia bacterium]